MARERIVPRLPDPFRTEDPRHEIWMLELIRQLEDSFRATAEPVSIGWQLTNVPSPAQRTLDADTATLDDTRKVLSTLLNDLRENGVIN